MTLTSDFIVTAVEQFGQKQGVGSLANSFAITLGGAEHNGRFIMGSQMNVKIQWLLDGMTDLNFKITGCVVSHGDVDVHIIKDECYADVIKAEPLEATRSLQGLTYNIFKTAGSDEFTQHIRCNVRVCKDECQRRSDNRGCNRSGQMPYSFKEIDIN